MDEYIAVKEQVGPELETDCMVPLGDIIDRLSILILSVENGKISENDETLVAYVNLFNADRRLHTVKKQHYLSRIKSINNRMWSLESIIRNPENRPLEMIGRTALLLRKLNKKRIAIRQNIDAEIRSVPRSSSRYGNVGCSPFEKHLTKS